MKTMRLVPVMLALGALTLAFTAPSLAGADGKAVYEAKCRSCHGADGAKALLSKPVKGLKPAEVEQMMAGYKAKTFGGAKKATMENLAAALPDEDIKAVAAYIGTL